MGRHGTTAARIALTAMAFGAWHCGSDSGFDGNTDTQQPQDASDNLLDHGDVAVPDPADTPLDTSDSTADLSPGIAGTYELTSMFNVVTGLPPQAQVVLNFLLEFLSNPTSNLMILMCDPNLWSPSSLEDLCRWLFEDPANPSLDALTAAGESARRIIDVQWSTILNGMCPYRDPQLCGTAWGSVYSITDPLRRLMLLSRVDCAQEPGSDGRVPAGGCREEWHTLQLSLGSNPPTALALTPFEGVTNTLQADLEVTFSHGNSQMHVAQHKVNLRYGRLVDLAVEKILMPYIYGDGTDGLPAVDAIEAMMGALLAGKGCLRNYSCCDDFAANLSSQAGSGMSEVLIEAACDALITNGASYVRSFLLDIDTPPSDFRLGTPVDTPCTLRDFDDDQRWDGLGSASSPCTWDASLMVGQYPYAPTGTFYGLRK